MSKHIGFQNKLSSFQIIILGFAGVIVLGALLLMLPISTQNGVVTPFSKTLFTATSAVCVTGLVVFDTASYWSGFGQLIILIMIQIGGLGVISVASFLSMLAGRKISLMQRQTMQNALSAPQMGGIVKLTRFIFLVSFAIEGIGALLLMPVFMTKYGIRGIWMAVFHSVSAFCNAGFDLMGKYEVGSSLALFEKSFSVMVPIAMLIIVGGIGFQVWMDLLQNRHHVKRFSLHTKVALTSTLVLILGGWVLYFIFEYDGHLAVLTMPQKVLSSFFMSVTTRTAGFAGFDLTELSQSGSLLTMILMLVGGCPGSTAGGMKTTTVAVMVLSVCGMSRGHSDITVFKRRLNKDLIKHAAVIVFVYITAVLGATLAICAVEGVNMSSVLFETCSALGTAGLSQGLSASAGEFTKIVLIILMYGGRIGGLSLLLVFAEKKTEPPLKRPAEKIMIG